jgi:hypothetical protein
MTLLKCSIFLIDLNKVYWKLKHAASWEQERSSYLAVRAGRHEQRQGKGRPKTGAEEGPCSAPWRLSISVM